MSDFKMDRTTDNKYIGLPADAIQRIRGHMGDKPMSNFRKEVADLLRPWLPRFNSITTGEVLDALELLHQKYSVPDEPTLKAVEAERDRMAERLKQVVDDVTDIYESMDASYDRHCMYEFERRLEEVHAENLRIAGEESK